MSPQIKSRPETMDYTDERMLSSVNDGSVLLPKLFVPSKIDVICGWARQNRHFRKSILLIKAVRSTQNFC
jgi:hypothetical protein